MTLGVIAACVPPSTAPLRPIKPVAEPSLLSFHSPFRARAPHSHFTVPEPVHRRERAWELRRDRRCSPFSFSSRFGPNPSSLTPSSSSSSPLHVVVSLGAFPDATNASFGPAIYSSSFPCPRFLFSCTESPYRQALDHADHGATVGPAPRRAPCPCFQSSQVREAVRITPVLSVRSEAAGIINRCRARLATSHGGLAGTTVQAAGNPPLLSQSSDRL